MDVSDFTTVRSDFGPKETANRLVAALGDRGIPLLARIDHAAGAAAVGLDLRPTEVFIFGHPRSGTPLMQAVQTIGIDLPLRMLVWQDDRGGTWVGYNDPGRIAQRHGADASAAIVVQLRNALVFLAEQATGKTRTPLV